MFAPGHGRAVEVTQQWVGPLGIGGTRLFFEYEHSGHFDATKGLRRQADRDAAETAAVIGQRLDRGHPLEVAEQWAYALRARLEIFPADGLLWTAHRPRFAAVLSDFLDVG